MTRVLSVKLIIHLLTLLHGSLKLGNSFLFLIRYLHNNYKGDNHYNYGNSPEHDYKRLRLVRSRSREGGLLSHSTLGRRPTPEE
jgi:hypothetical protein